MQALVSTGKVRAVGVSNFSIPDLKELLPHSTEVPISCNQIEVHPWLPQNDLVAFCKKHEILTTCYSPFAGQKPDGKTLLKDETVLKVARKNNMDAGQVLSSWAVQRGTVPLGKSGTEARIRRNFAVRRLEDESMAVLNGLEVPGGKGRTVDYSEPWGIGLFDD
jgi:glycerol 2-dehydrogenase (NADP+)